MHKDASHGEGVEAAISVLNTPMFVEIVCLTLSSDTPSLTAILCHLMRYHYDFLNQKRLLISVVHCTYSLPTLIPWCHLHVHSDWHNSTSDDMSFVKIMNSKLANDPSQEVGHKQLCGHHSASHKQ